MNTSDIILTVLLHGLQFGVAWYMVGAANKPVSDGSEQSLF